MRWRGDGIPILEIPSLEDLLKLIASFGKSIVLVVDEYQDLRRMTKGEVVDAISGISSIKPLTTSK